MIMYTNDRRPYPSDVRDNEWASFAALTDAGFDIWCANPGVSGMQFALEMGRTEDVRTAPCLNPSRLAGQAKRQCS